MKPFRSFDSIKKQLGPQANRAPFSALVGWGKVRVTLFYFGGWNMMGAEICNQYPEATYQKSEVEETWEEARQQWEAR